MLNQDEPTVTRRRGQRPPASRVVEPTLEGTNVVRFPRQWFGQPEELVPFGPSLLRPLSDADPAHDPADPAHDPAGPAHDPAGPAHDAASLAHELTGPAHEPTGPAHDFWGENSAAVQDVLEAPAVRSRAAEVSAVCGRAVRALAGDIHRRRSVQAAVAIGLFAALISLGAVIRALGWGGASRGGPVRGPTTAQSGSTHRSTIPRRQRPAFAVATIPPLAPATASPRQQTERRTPPSTHNRRPTPRPPSATPRSAGISGAAEANSQSAATASAGPSSLGAASGTAGVGAASAGTASGPVYSPPANHPPSVPPSGSASSSGAKPGGAFTLGGP